MQIEKAGHYIRDLLNKKLPSNLHYHNYEHTMDVFRAASELLEDEKVTDEMDQGMIKAAALFHDSGFVHVYDGHEEESCKLAREVLPDLDFTSRQINVICDMIMKTNLKVSPATPLEKILCDADLDYLGRDDFEFIGKKLFDEWVALGKVTDERQWNELQLRFLEKHRYWTPSAIRKRESLKQKHLADLRYKLV